VLDALLLSDTMKDRRPLLLEGRLGKASVEASPPRRAEGAVVEGAHILFRPGPVPCDGLGQLVARRGKERGKGCGIFESTRAPSNAPSGGPSQGFLSPLLHFSRHPPVPSEGVLPSEGA
jgi:hypothetical protein